MLEILELLAARILDQVGRELQVSALGEDHTGVGEEKRVNFKFACIPCDMSFRDVANLRRHVRLMHGERKTPVQCPRTFCNAEFGILAEMMQHKRAVSWSAPTLTATNCSASRPGLMPTRGPPWS